jgi:hypothetical protein
MQVARPEVQHQVMIEVNSSGEDSFCYQLALSVPSGTLLLTIFTKLKHSLYCECIIFFRLNKSTALIKQ